MVSWKSFFAGVLAALILVALVFFWFTSTNEVTVRTMGKKEILLVGEPSESMTSQINSEDFALMGFTVTDIFPDSAVSTEALSNAGIVMFQNTPNCDSSFTAYRELEIKPRLMFIGDACSESGPIEPAFNTETDRKYFLAANAPVEKRIVNGDFEIAVYEHPLFNGILNHAFQGEAAVYELAPKSMTLAYLTENGIETPAIVKNAQGLFFAYDPALQADNGGSRNLLSNALAYLSGDACWG